MGAILLLRLQLSCFTINYDILIFFRFARRYFNYYRAYNFFSWLYDSYFIYYFIFCFIHFCLGPCFYFCRQVYSGCPYFRASLDCCSYSIFVIYGLSFSLHFVYNWGFFDSFSNAKGNWPSMVLGVWVFSFFN